MHIVDLNVAISLVPKGVYPVKCLNYNLIYYLMALQHLLTTQTRAMKHKPITLKSPANQPSPSGPHYTPLGTAGLKISQGQATRVTKIVILHTPVTCRDQAKRRG